MEAGLTEEFEFIGVKQEPLEEPEHVGVKQELLEDEDDGGFLPQEPECILELKDDDRLDDVQTGEPRPTQEPECIIVQKEDGSGGGEQEGGPTQMQEDGAQQTAGGREEELILGLVPKVEWVPPTLPVGEEAVRDPLTSEGDVVTDSMNEEVYTMGWSHTSDKNRHVSSGEMGLATVNNGGPPFNNFAGRRCRSDGTELVRQAFRCDSCSAIFSAKYHLVNHVFTHIANVSPPSHVCRRCGEVFCDTPSLVEHSKGHEIGPGVPAVVHERRRPRRPAGGARKCIRTKSHICDQCGKAFAYLGNLILHERTHSGKRPYECDVCGREFAQAVHLQNHRVTHTAEKRHYCEFCGRAFAVLHNFKVHLRMHTGENPYNCRVCGASFNLLSKFKTHELIHSGKKPYACDECGGSFSTLNNLQRHKRKHSGEKPYCCDACGERFMWYETLQRHKQVHTGEKPFKCDLCSGAFAEMGGLNRHMRTHSRHTEKPFKCHLCVSAFAEQGGLNRHMSCHKGDRPHACDRCGAAFTAVNQLRRHRNKQHPENTTIANA